MRARSILFRPSAVDETARSCLHTHSPSARKYDATEYGAKKKTNCRCRRHRVVNLHESFVGYDKHVCGLNVIVTLAISNNLGSGIEYALKKMKVCKTHYKESDTFINIVITTTGEIRLVGDFAKE